ncbi:MAG TPA: hypothetical protein VN903_20945 [Polyangia bacterium]|jgi:hypothetical protein|nr:hypothetical protein [Polyangia bacterium]
MTDPAQSKPPAGAVAGNSKGVDEFAHIPRRRSRNPIITLAGALLAFFLVFYGRRDLRYALSSSDPVELGNASVVFNSDKATVGLENRYVRVAGTPDRESALELDTKGSWVFSQLFRVLGTGDRLFVHRLQNPLPAERAEADVFEGRLIRVDDLPYADAIRSYFARHVTATRYFAPDAFVKALAARAPGAPLAVVDRGGDRVSLAAEEALAIEVARPDEVQIGLPRARFATEDAARAAIVAHGGEVTAAKGLVKAPAPQGAGSSSLLASAPEQPARWTFVVKFPAARRQAALDELGDIDRTVEIRDARETIATHTSELSADGGALIVRAPGAAERRLAAADVAAVHTIGPVVIPADAYLLVEGDRPRDHLSSILIALVLMTFGVFNIVALVRNR